MFKLGYINYLNCYPFYHKMFVHKDISSVQIVSAYPSELNKMIAEKKLNMGPISAAEYAFLQDDVKILPQFCLSSIGYVKSVIIASRKPIENLNNCRIGLTKASKTSVILLKILLNGYYKIDCEYEITDPYLKLNDYDAKLIIGNEAMMMEKEPIPYIYDLGDLWLQKTGYPIVFAIFVAQKNDIKYYHDTIETIINSYTESLKMLEYKPDEVIYYAKKKYPDILYDVKAYYQLLKFNFTDDLKEALLFYYKSAAKYNLLPEVKTLKYMYI